MPRQSLPTLPIHLAAAGDSQVTFNIGDLPERIRGPISVLDAGEAVRIVVRRGPRRKTADWLFYVNRAGKTCTSYTYPIGYALPTVGSPVSFELTEVNYRLF